MKEIPKIIHYCWFGGNALPPSAEKCINSWKRFFPDYEVKEWNESNCDINTVKYVQDAYKEKRYAFVSDYFRFWVIYNYGGFYFDTDVEVIKSFNDIIACGNFMGCESDKEGLMRPNPGLGFAAVPKLPFFKQMLDVYETLSFFKADGSYNTVSIDKYTQTEILKFGFNKNEYKVQQCADIFFYPPEYFCPYDHNIRKEIILTPNTHSIHNYTATWHTKGQKAYQLFEKVFGFKLAQIVSNFLKRHSIVKG